MGKKKEDQERRERYIGERERGGKAKTLLNFNDRIRVSRRTVPILPIKPSISRGKVREKAPGEMIPN